LHSVIVRLDRTIQKIPKGNDRLGNSWFVDKILSTLTYRETLYDRN